MVILQLLGENNWFMTLLWWIPLILFMLYGQRIQAMFALNDVARSLNKLRLMKERARKEAINYVSKICGRQEDLTPRIDRFLEYFTIMPASMDPAGIVQKIEHIVNVKDERVRAEIRRMVPQADPVHMSTMENILEAATALNMLYKLVRHFYLFGKKTQSFFIIIQLQMIMPLIMQEAEAFNNAIEAFKQAQPIGDGIGAMVAARMMLGKEKRVIAKDTVMSESEYKGRTLYLIKAEGPAGHVGEPGTAIDRLVSEMRLTPSAIVMIDAALKLEGEKTGEIAEGIGAAIGGIGVDRYKIEEVATKHRIPLYAVIIKESILDAITVMKKEIAETVERVVGIVQQVIEEKTKEGDKVIVVGVGNSLGIGQ